MFTSSISKFDSFSVQFGFLFFAIICKTLAHLLNSKCYDTVKMSTQRLYTCVYMGFKLGEMPLDIPRNNFPTVRKVTYHLRNGG